MSLFLDYNSPVIYKITNNVNNKCYIGSTVNFKQRKSEHLRMILRNGHYNKHLQRAVNKYGISLFTFTIIEFINNPDELIKREQYWIDRLKPAYNIALLAGTTLGIKHTEETKIRMSISKKGKQSPRKGAHLSIETKQKLKLANIGKKQSFETIEKRMIKIRGRKKPEGLMIKLQAYITPDVRKRNDEARKKPILEYSSNGDFIRRFNGVKDVAEFYKIHPATVTGHLHGKTRLCQDHIFIFEKKAKK